MKIVSHRPEQARWAWNEYRFRHKKGKRALIGSLVELCMKAHYSGWSCSSSHPLRWRLTTFKEGRGGSHTLEAAHR